ncbi:MULTISPECIES: restriction endonuclease subunit S [Acinetobacter]|nr:MULTISPECIES: restriction endonuclease subunit S [Acinetobacter]SSR47613.1 restriction endonuclease S subunits-like protein [Acinetobacter baumannii]MBJ8463674.1 restriction endonuclease subunit S [Acinetobacter nosocomialis]MBP1488258.1 restriction endonuclease subunit S [Acinetobacter nosocomialis]MBP1496645.1 restriction endonuclease subunit S [Acinetobacter nosocomialis]MBR7692282.1 restriction endonuclease subunit S [Acinetobacter nosocomialis]
MVTPKLRFKEFNEDWSKSSIIELSKEKDLNNGVFNDQNKVGKGYKLINVLDMYIERDIDEARLSLLDLDAKEFERNKVKYGDIFFTRSSLVKEGIAFSNVYLGNSNDVTYDGHLIKLSPDLERIDPLFLNFSLKTANVRKQLIQGGKTATMTTIGQKEIGSCQLDIPSKKEQTKIASFLCTIDEKIAQLTQKHELLSQYKQGMMQKLFSQQIRFKADDGSEFGEWEEIKLGDIASKVGSGSTPRGGAEAYTEDGIIFIRSQNVNNNQLLLDDVVYIPEQTHKKMSGSKVVANDILLNITGASIGRSCVVPMNFTEANVNQHVCIIRTPNDNPRFIQSFLASKDGQNLIDSHQTGSGREGLNFQSIRSFTLNRPCLEEQTQIANFLSAIDKKIEKVTQQIEETKQWKKGLLQQMFV